ncbi:MAG: 2-C-methyl-D-erythritol 4-phosphate cytidylyltransferase [Desulfitobacteriia bacterium]|jgi:2-C-methyl-D-erythritol 4-phosphate cytidylyltransferase
MNIMLLDKLSAIIPAAGMGKRMGARGNKLLLELAGYPVLLFPLQIFNKCLYIKEIIIPAARSDIPTIENLVQEYKIDKVKAIVPGGKERQDSVFKALEFVNPQTKKVVIHDGARPLLTLEVLNKFLEQAFEYQAAIMAVACKDTIKKVSTDGWVKQSLDREELQAVQTPQVFDRLVLEKVHKVAREQKFYSTDDASLFEWQGLPVKVLKGCYENFKITTPEDLILAEAILKRRGEEKL